MRCDFARKLVFGSLVGKQSAEFRDESSPMCHISPFLGEQLLDYTRHLTPALGLIIERLQSRLRDGVVLRFAILFRFSPRGTRPAALLDPDKSRINRSLIEIQSVLRYLLEPACDT